MAWNTNSFTQFVGKLGGNENNARNFLIDKEIFPLHMECPKCGNEIQLNRETLVFWCRATMPSIAQKKKQPRVRCNYKISARNNTWFSLVRLPLLTCVIFIAEWLWIPGPRSSFIAADLGVANHTIVDWSSFCREICVYWVNETSTPIGGPGKIVEIDEAKFGKRKFNKGRLLKGNWVFGGIERNNKKVFLAAVKDRSSKTLLEIIKQWILPGTTIYSDCWKSYNCLNSEGYQHLTVNHLYNFVDPETGAHTQNIERTWREVRGNISRYGVRADDLHSYLCEYLFKRCYSESERIDVFFEFIKKYGAVDMESTNVPSTSSE